MDLRQLTVQTREKSHQPRKRLHSLPVTNTKTDKGSVSNHPSLKSTLKRPEREHANVDEPSQVAYYLKIITENLVEYCAIC